MNCQLSPKILPREENATTTTKTTTTNTTILQGANKQLSIYVSNHPSIHLAIQPSAFVPLFAFFLFILLFLLLLLLLLFLRLPLQRSL